MVNVPTVSVDYHAIGHGKCPYHDGSPNHDDHPTPRCHPGRPHDYLLESLITGSPFAFSLPRSGPPGQIGLPLHLWTSNARHRAELARLRGAVVPTTGTTSDLLGDEGIHSAALRTSAAMATTISIPRTVSRTRGSFISGTSSGHGDSRQFWMTVFDFPAVPSPECKVSTIVHPCQRSAG